FMFFFFFFFNDTATTEIYTLSLHDALPLPQRAQRHGVPDVLLRRFRLARCAGVRAVREALSRSGSLPAGVGRALPAGPWPVTESGGQCPPYEVESTRDCSAIAAAGLRCLAALMKNTNTSRGLPRGCTAAACGRSAMSSPAAQACARVAQRSSASGA